jgi:hypothetical protein
MYRPSLFILPIHTHTLHNKYKDTGHQEKVADTVEPVIGKEGKLEGDDVGKEDEPGIGGHGGMLSPDQVQYPPFQGKVQEFQGYRHLAAVEGDYQGIEEGAQEKKGHSRKTDIERQGKEKEQIG